MSSLTGLDTMHLLHTYTAIWYVMSVMHSGWPILKCQMDGWEGGYSWIEIMVEGICFLCSSEDLICLH